MRIKFPYHIKILIVLVRILQINPISQRILHPYSAQNNCTHFSKIIPGMDSCLRWKHASFCTPFSKMRIKFPHSNSPILVILIMLVRILQILVDQHTDSHTSLMPFCRNVRTLQETIPYTNNAVCATGCIIVKPLFAFFSEFA